MNYYLKRTFSTLREFKAYVIVAFVFVSVYVTHEHFVPTVTFVFDWIVISLPGETDTSLDPHGKIEALLFISKICATALTALAFLTFFGLFFGLLASQTQVIENLDRLKEKQAVYLNGFTRLQKQCIDFLNEIEQFMGRQKYEINKCDSAIQTLAIESISLQNTINGLSVEIAQLRAIIAALGRDLAPSDKSDDGDF